MKLRLFLAVVISCFLAWLVFFTEILLIFDDIRPSHVYFSNPPMSIFVPFALTYLPVPFVFALVIGIPLRIFMGKRKLYSFFTFTVTGTLIGVLIGIIFSLTDGSSMRHDFIHALFSRILSFAISSTVGFAIFGIIAAKEYSFNDREKTFSMKESEEETLRQMYNKWSTERLLEVVTKHRNEYAIEAVDLMLAELQKRKIEMSSVTNSVRISKSIK